MKRINLGLLLTTFALSAVAQSATSPFDGAWAVHLTCEDTRDKNGAIVNGYVFDFPVTVQAGQLNGRRGELGQASSLQLAGSITDGGVARIQAQGFTGKPDYTVGHVRPASPYSYTLDGRFVGAHGHAERLELRRCSAEFERTGSAS